jgi:hypothetical protein
MNLFRSGESVRAWSDFNPETGKSIKPVREWAAMLTGAELFTRRLDADFVARSEAYANAALGALGQALS